MNAFSENNLEIQTTAIVLETVSWVLSSMLTKAVRTIEQFAEDEVFLPNDGGPFEGQLFAVRRQPFVSLLWKEMQSPRWSEVWVTGCVQSGKTLSAFVIPLIYMLVELQKSPIAAIPDGTMELINGQSMLSRYSRQTATSNRCFLSRVQVPKVVPQKHMSNFPMATRSNS